MDMEHEWTRLDLVNEDEGLPAEPAHAQGLALRQLPRNPRQQCRYLGSTLVKLQLQLYSISCYKSDMNYWNGRYLLYQE